MGGIINSLYIKTTYV